MGLLVKRGTRDEVVTFLNQAINRALAKPELRNAIARLGAEPAGGSPAEFAEFLTGQVAYWAKVVADSGMKMHQ
jgi:tripartite-type tricarboxylate transporter receptor subunit TctC